MTQSARQQQSVSCTATVPLLEAFLDGELCTEQTLQVEAHLEACGDCDEHARFLQSMSQAIRQVASNDAVVQPEFLSRLNRAVDAEIAREEAREPTTSAWPSRGATVAIAASITLWFGLQHEGVVNRAENKTLTGPAATSRAQAFGGSDDSVLTLEGALDRLIDYHSSPPKPQVTTAELIPQFEPDVGVRLELPRLDQYGATWKGASLVPVNNLNNQRAASFSYQLPGHRVTLYVFNASRLRVREHVKGKAELDNPIYVGQWRGYTVAAKEHRGTGYALAADMDDAVITEMMTAIH